MLKKKGKNFKKNGEIEAKMGMEDQIWEIHHPFRGSLRSRELYKDE